MTRTAYQTIGGVLGALGQRAESLFAELEPAQRAAARQLFLRLVTLGEGVEDTRRRVLLSELHAMRIGHQGEGETGASGSLDSVLHPVLERYGAARLLTFDQEVETRAPTVEVAHEALLREWPRLSPYRLEGGAPSPPMRMVLSSYGT